MVLDIFSMVIGSHYLGLCLTGPQIDVGRTCIYTQEQVANEWVIKWMFTNTIFYSKLILSIHILKKPVTFLWFCGKLN